MGAQTAKPREVISIINPITSGDITYLDFNDVGITPGTFKYYLIDGNLFAGFFRSSFQNSAADVMLAADAASLARIALILGITIDTSYTRSTSGGPSVLAWNGATWTSSGVTSVVDMILAV